MMEPAYQFALVLGSLIINGLLAVTVISMRFTANRLLADLASNTAATKENAVATAQVSRELHTFRSDFAQNYAPVAALTALGGRFDNLNVDMRERVVKIEAGMSRMRELEEKSDRYLIELTRLQTEIKHGFVPK